jgi:actin-related protein
MNNNYITFFRNKHFSESQNTSIQSNLYHSPITQKEFNLSSSYSEDSALKDLIGIMNFILSILKISLNEIRQHNLVLILPNEFCRKNYEKFIECLIKKYMFKGISLQLESVMACFSAGLPLCLHCHIGYTSSYISIVEEGVIRPNSIQEINFGLKDVADLFLFYVLRKRGIDLSDYDSNMTIPLLLLKYASFLSSEEEPSSYIIELFNYKTRQWDNVEIFRSDMAIAVNSIFIDNAFLGKHNRSLHRIILEMLARLTNVDLQKKLAVSIVLTGFLSSNPKIIDRFEEKLIRYIEVHNYQLEEVMVIDALTVRNLVPFNLMWGGGAILPKLDSFGDLLINSHQYLGRCFF